MSPQIHRLYLREQNHRGVINVATDSQIIIKRRNHRGVINVATDSKVEIEIKNHLSIYKYFWTQTYVKLIK